MSEQVEGSSGSSQEMCVEKQLCMGCQLFLRQNKLLKEFIDFEIRVPERQGATERESFHPLAHSIPK